LETVEEAYYLVENENGFEETLRAGTEAELEAEKLRLRIAETLSHQTDGGKQAWKRATYYLVPKAEWDREHCPLVPVDLS